MMVFFNCHLFNIGLSLLLSIYLHGESSRNPSQVFMLLEVLYGAFDKIASCRKVFKVETIGDCYVAATGLVSNYYCIESFLSPLTLLI
jgi:Adenylate and Guanylate cyclase catalytic domain